MAQFRLARLCLMLAAIGVSAPALVSSAYAQQKSDAPAAAAPAAGKKSIRPEMFKLLDPTGIKSLIEAKNFGEVKNRILQAEALPNRIPYEDYVINVTKLSLAEHSGDNATAISLRETILASGHLTLPQTLSFYQAQGDSNFNTKNYAKAIEWYNRYTKEGGDPAQVRRGLTLAQINSGDFASAKKSLTENIENAKKAGQKPVEDDVRRLGQEADKAKDTEAYVYALENLVQYYPNDEFWFLLLNRGVARKVGFDDTYTPNLLRLELAAMRKLPPEHYVYLTEVALRDGFPAEAKSVLDKGFSAGVLGTGNDAKTHNTLRSKATKQAAEDFKSIAAGEASATKSKTGAGLVNLGWAYTTMDQAEKGIGFIQQGIAKGGLKTPDEAKLRLGMAQARAGKKSEAIQTFQGIKGSTGAGDLARYWIMLLSNDAAAETAPK